MKRMAKPMTQAGMTTIVMMMMMMSYDRTVEAYTISKYAGTIDSCGIRGSGPHEGPGMPECTFVTLLSLHGHVHGARGAVRVCPLAARPDAP